MLIAFILGMVEFRSDVTSHTNHPEAYDWGREVAHIATFRKFDH